MIGFIIALGLGAFGKWRWLGYVFLLDLVIYAGTGFVRGDGFELVMILVLPLVEIAVGYGLGMAFGRWRKGHWPRDRAIDNLNAFKRGLDVEGEEFLVWEIESGVLTPQILRVFGVLFVVLFVLMAAIFVLIRPDDMIGGLIIAAIVSGVLFALFAFVIFGLLFNRLRRTFVLTAKGYTVSVSDPRLFAGIAATGAAGLAGSSASMTGSAALGAAASRRGESHNWQSVIGADYRPDRRRIGLRFDRGGWLGRDSIQCTPESYPAASAWVARHAGKAGTPSDTDLPSESVNV